MTPRPGSKLAGGRYQLVRELGAGGNGVVWLAMHRGMNAETVVKFPKGWWEASGVSHQQLQQEAQSLAMFSSRHPNIVNILDVGEMHGRPFVVMQFMRRGSLGDYCAGGRLANERNALGQSLNWLRMIADALDFVHREHLIHRDVKPANVLLDDSFSPYLADFGLAAMERANGAPGSSSVGLFGSLPYMAPEVLRGRPAAPASDQFALAVTVYEFITGTVPFRGANLAELVSSQEKDWIRWQSASPSGLDGALWRIISRALHPQVDSRYANCAQFAELLADAWPRAPFASKTGSTTSPADTQNTPMGTVNVDSPRPIPPRPTPSQSAAIAAEPSIAVRKIKIQRVLDNLDRQ